MHVMVSHLLFADDILLFCRASKRSFTTINSLLDNLAPNTGLTVNREKCKLYLSKGCREKEMLSSLIQMAIGCLPAKYLGLPLSQNYIKATECIALIDKFRNYIER